MLFIKMPHKIKNADNARQLLVTNIFVILKNRLNLMNLQSVKSLRNMRVLELLKFQKMETNLFIVCRKKMVQNLGF